jgi:hypothetical protein
LTKYEGGKIKENEIGEVSSKHGDVKMNEIDLLGNVNGRNRFASPMHT